MEITVGSILGRSLSTLMKHYGVFALLALVFQIPNVLINLFVTPKMGQVGAVVQGITDHVTSGLIAGAVIFGVVEALRGNKPNFGKCLNVTFSRFAPIFIVSLLFGLGVGLGMVLLIVPGVILYCMWFVAIPATAVERTGISESFSRSAELTRGHRMTIFLAFLVFVGLSILVMMVVLMPMVLSGAAAPLVFGLMILVAITVGLWGQVAMGVTYHDLRVAKEGIKTEDLAEVFA